jgi:hypothetical protein
MAKAPLEIKSLARTYTTQAIETLVHIMRAPKSPPATRIMAAEILLDRGWGKATQVVEATITNVDASRVSDMELAAIIAGDGGEGTPEAPIDPAQLN